MPLYEYKCHGCGKTFEVIQKFSDDPLKTHPECGGEVERLLSPPALQFKGSGWYITDYARNGKSKGEAKAESGEKKSGSESSSGDAKPAASSETKPASTSSTSTSDSK